MCKELHVHLIPAISGYKPLELCYIIVIYQHEPPRTGRSVCLNSVSQKANYNTSCAKIRNLWIHFKARSLYPPTLRLVSLYLVMQTLYYINKTAINFIRFMNM